MPLTTSTAGVQALRLVNEHTAEPSRRVDHPGPNGRKRRRITPTNLVEVPPIGTVETETAGLSYLLNTVSSSSEPETWNHLAKWEAADDTIIGDIEEEEYYSDVSGGSPGATEVTGYESEEGDHLLPEESTTKPSKLGTDKVTEIINDCIEKYTNAWRPGKGETKHKDEEGQMEVPVVYDALALWEEAEAAGQREELATKYELEAGYYRQRLDKLCEAISKDPGDTIAGVEMKCRNLEVTVELFERARWLEEIYKLPPDASSDDESQNETPIAANTARVPTPQPPNPSQHRNLLSQVIDLGTPSESDDSEGDGVPMSNISATPAQISDISKQGQNTEPRLLVSNPVVFDSIETSEPVVAASSTTSVRSRVPLGDAPQHASISTVSRWSWAQLEEAQDRKRVVSKAIYELSSTDRETIRRRLQKVGRANMIREIPACVDMLLCGNEKMPGILPQDLPKIVTFTRLFLCWWLCGNYLQKEPSELDLRDLADCLGKRSPDLLIFCDYVDTVLSTTFSHAALSFPTQPSQAEIIEISDDDEPPLQFPKWCKSNVDKPGRLDKSAAIVID